MPSVISEEILSFSSISSYPAPCSNESIIGTANFSTANGIIANAKLESTAVSNRSIM